ncbi:spermidine synthase [Rosettibacter firmus]|uniref:spermidine synthase n=1 Tax=Rosettibacter firmus TaxID=3111522 RepID=UPI00336BE86B
MKNENLLIYIVTFFLSITVISFEIISTRVSSVIFVHNYAFIILSFAISGLGFGSIYSFYKLKSIQKENATNLIFRFLTYYGFSLALFILIITLFSITNHFLFFLFLFIPFFIAGILYSQIFKLYSDYSFKLYAADLTGAALGSLLPLLLLNILGASNFILLLSLIIIFISFSFKFVKEKPTVAPVPIILLITIILVFINGSRDLIGKIPIGKFDEKDFYYVYPDPEIKANILESRWSIYGRTDLVAYSHQDVVRQMFIDGAAGTQMYRFNGNIQKAGKTLLELLLEHTTTIPFLYLNENQKDSMLIIGPGGGKEVLIGLFAEVKNITGVEVNPDFVNMVKDYKNYNGGIYTNFPNVNIIIKEGRNYIKQVNKKFDLIVIALPSTKQLQNIDALAMNENYLLTVEALNDYLNVLTPEGMLIFTLHNKWELLRFIVTSMKAFEKNGIKNQNFVNHVIVLESDYAPTILIKKTPFKKEELIKWNKKQNELPARFHKITFMPYLNNEANFNNVTGSIINNFLYGISTSQFTLNEFIEEHPYDITPCYDNNPFFYKVSKFLPSEYTGLFFTIFIISLIFVLKLLTQFKKELVKSKILTLRKLLIVFASIGTGFMIIEVVLFQKMILYLGSPTVSLSILLCSILLGMGAGSYSGNKIISNNHYKRLFVTSSLIIFYGLILFLIVPEFLNQLMSINQVILTIIIFLLILPLGFLLGIPFPTSIKLLREQKLENYIPWMYGINATLSVFGSVFSILLAMLYGFNISFFAGLFFYALVLVAFKGKTS